MPVGVSVGLKPTDAELHDQVQGYIEEGYARVKIKIKPGRDIEMLAGLRERFPDTAFMADANSAYSLSDIDRLKEFDALGLTMIEQPLSYSDFLDHARLQEQIETPVCLDESVKSVGDLALALHLGSCRIVNIKPGRVGASLQAAGFTIPCVQRACRSGVVGCLSREWGALTMWPWHPYLASRFQETFQQVVGIGTVISYRLSLK